MSSIKNTENIKYVNSVLCSIPVETPGGKLRRKRSEGPVPIMPKIAITSLNHWAKKIILMNASFLTSICFTQVIIKLKNI